MLPRMIQMGICDSSGLEISNVICEGRASESAAASGQGQRDGGGAEHPLPSGGCWSCWG